MFAGFGTFFRIIDDELGQDARRLKPGLSQNLDLARVIDRRACRLILRKELEAVLLILADRAHGLVGVAEGIGIIDDAVIDAVDPDMLPQEINMLDDELPKKTRIEDQCRFNRKPRSAIASVLESHEATLKRMRLFDGNRARKHEHDQL